VVRTLAEQVPDATLAESVDAYPEEAGLRVSNSATTRALRRLGITRKKDIHATEREIERVRRLRAEHWGTLGDVPIDRLVFLDEGVIHHPVESLFHGPR
jgi:hypothetical protein